MLHDNFTLVCLGVVIVLLLAWIRIRQHAKANPIRVEPYSREVHPEDFVDDQIIAVRRKTDLEDEAELDSSLQLDDDDDVLLHQMPEPTFSNSDGELIAINVMSKDRDGFTGYELLQSILAADLRHGMMDIFHYYQTQDEQRKVLFSLASCQEPGTFNIQQMGGFSCKGLCLFMQTEGSEQDQKTFDLMLSTAMQLAEELGGFLTDAQREELNNQDIHNIRDRLAA